MDVLKELIGIVDRNRLTKILPLGSEALRDSRLMQLYDGIYDGGLSDDDSAFQSLYESENERNSFYKLKFDLREKLKQTILYLPIPNVGHLNVRQRKAYAECNRAIALVNILSLHRAFRAMEQVSAKALKLATKYEFTTEQLSLSRSLRNLQVGAGYDKNRFDELSVLIQQASKLISIEMLVEASYMQLSALYWGKRPPQDEVVEFTGRVLAELDPVVNSSERLTLRIYFMLDYLRMANALARKDFAGALKIGHQGLDRINNYSYFNGIAYRTIALQVIMCHTQLKQYQEAAALISAASRAVVPNTFNDLQLRQLEVVNSFHALDFSHAAEVYRKVTQHSSFRKYSSDIREFWLLLDAWLWVLGQHEEQTTASIFKVGKLSNQLNLLSRDRAGLNIPIVVVKFLLLTKMEKDEEVDKLAEFVMQYRYRYVMEDYNKRSKVFLDMLILLPQNNFRTAMVKKAAVPYLKKLGELPIEVTGQDHDIEIAPYEIAWEIVMRALEKRGRN